MTLSTADLQALLLFVAVGAGREIRDASARARAVVEHVERAPLSGPRLIEAGTMILDMVASAAPPAVVAAIRPDGDGVPVSAPVPPQPAPPARDGSAAPWLPADDEALRRMVAERRTDRQIAGALGRTGHAIEARRKRLGLKHRGVAPSRPWAEDDAELRRLHGEGKTNAEIAAALGRTELAVQMRFYNLGLRRDPGLLRERRRATPPAPRGRAWDEDDVVLRRMFAAGASDAEIRRALPHRTENAIAVRATRLGLQRGLVRPVGQGLGAAEPPDPQPVPSPPRGEGAGEGASDPREGASDAPILQPLVAPAAEPITAAVTRPVAPPPRSAGPVPLPPPAPVIAPPMPRGRADELAQIEAAIAAGKRQVMPSGADLAAINRQVIEPTSVARALELLRRCGSAATQSSNYRFRIDGEDISGVELLYERARKAQRDRLVEDWRAKRVKGKAA